MIFIAFLLVITTLLVLPGQAWSASKSGGAGGPDGTTPTTSQDLALMLPSGRWGQQIGSIIARTEPGAKNIGGFLGNMSSSIATNMRLVLPNMLLMISQVCWNSALSLSQFAANFDPINTFGAKLDKSIGTLVDSIMSGGIPAVLIFLGIFGWMGAAAFNIGSSSEMVKRIGVTIVCLAMLIFTGAQATKDGDSSTPVTGSPWWAVSTINSAVNTLAFGVNLDGLADNDSNMMASSKSKSGDPNCQLYLYQMHKEYDEAAKKSTSGVNTSSVTKAVNRMWEETALRSFVTMQFGNPAADKTTTSTQVANNSNQAYCHTLEAYAHTDTATQMKLTNAELGTSINDQTARYLFNPTLGFIDPWNSKVNPDKDDFFDRGVDVYTQRAAVFWETCTANGGKGYARKGWAKLIRNIGDEGTGEIRGDGGISLRAERKGTSGKLPNVVSNDPGSTSPILSDDIGSICSNVFSNEIYKGGNETTPKDGADGKDFKGLAVGDSAGMGWRFDVPNVGGTWREANLEGGAGEGGSATMEDIDGVRATIDYLYGNAKIDTSGALGSMFGAICNMIVWGLLSLFLIVSKLMLTFCILAMIVAFLVAAFPFGDAPRKVLVKWAKGCINFAMVGILYAVLGSIATCICQMVISGTGMVASSFFYNFLTGISPALALVVIALTCGMLGLKNPFSIKAIATMVGGGALYAGITREGRRAAIQNIRNARGNHGSEKKGEEGRESSRASGTGNAHESAEVLRKGTSKNGQVKDGEEKDTKAKDEDEKSKVEKAEGGTIVATEKDDTSEDEKKNTEAELTDEEKKTLFGGDRWEDRDPNSIRGSIGHHVKETQAERREELAERLEKHQAKADKYVSDYMKHHPDASERELEKVRKHAATAQHFRDTASRARYMIPAMGSAAAGVWKSQPIRDNLTKAKRVAKTVAKVGVTAAAFSNPVTAGLGVLMTAKMMTNRQTLSDAAHSIGDTAHAAHSGFRAVTGLPKKAKELSNSRIAQPLITANNRFSQHLGTHNFAQIEADTDQNRIRVNNAANYRNKVENYQKLETAVANYEAVLRKQEQYETKKKFSFNQPKLADQQFSWKTQGDNEQLALSQEFDQARRELDRATQEMFPKQTPVQTPKWAVPSSTKTTGGQAKPQLKINTINPSGKKES